MWSEIQGKTLIDIRDESDGGLYFSFTDGTYLELAHHQDCCESVYLEDVIGCDPEQLRNVYITTADEPDNEITLEEIGQPGSDRYEDWTFYRLCTPKGDITFRWYGTSNGYYSTVPNCYWHKGYPENAPLFTWSKI